MRLAARIGDTSMCIVLCLLCCPGRGFSVTIRLVLALAWNRLIELLNHRFVIIVSIAPCTRGTIYLRYTSNYFAVLNETVPAAHILVCLRSSVFAIH